MPFFSILLLPVLWNILSSKKTRVDKFYSLFTLDCIFRIYWFQGYFFKVGDREIANLAVITEVVLVLYAIYLVFVNEIKLKRTFVGIFMFFAFVNFFGIFLEVTFPYDGLFLHEMSPDINWDKLVSGMCTMYNYHPTFVDFVSPYIHLLQFGVIIILFKHIYDKNRFIISYMKVVKYLKYGVFYGVFEFIIKNIIGNLTFTYELASFIIGENALYGYKEAYMKNGMYVLQGLTQEPSHFNCFLFTFIFLVILGNAILKYNPEYISIKPYNKVSVYIAIFLMVFSGGFSAVWYLLILLSALLIIQMRIEKVNPFKVDGKRILLFIFAMSFGTLLMIIVLQNDYFYNRLQDAFYVIDYLQDANNMFGIASMVSGDEGLGSTLARFVSTYVGLNIFFDRPLFGLGVNMQFVHSFTALFLANIGIVGIYSIYKLLACTDNDSRRFDKVLLFVVFIIGGLPITISPLGFSLHWLLFFEATAFYYKKKV